MDEWVDGWMGGKAGLRIAYSNQKIINIKWSRRVLILALFYDNKPNPSQMSKIRTSEALDFSASLYKTCTY